MKKALGVFFLANLLLINYAFAQTDEFKTAADLKPTKILDNLANASFFTFDFTGNYIIAEKVNNYYRVYSVTPAGEKTTLIERVSEPIVGLSFYQGKVYVSFRGRIAVIQKGRLSDIVSGLPAWGDYANSPVIFNDGKMYFSVGTATNSGVVGADNPWLSAQPSIHDLPCADFKVNKVNIEYDNFLTKQKNDKSLTGGFMPFNTPLPSDTVFGSFKCNGVIMRANPDGSGLEMVAYGFHNPKGLSFDSKNNLYTIDQAMEPRGVRPVKDARDNLFRVVDHTWYGWPDDSGVVQAPDPIIKDLPNPVPASQATFEPAHLSQFLINLLGSNSGLAIYDNSKIVEFALDNNQLNDFAMPPAGYGVSQIKFGPDQNLYVLIGNEKNAQLWKIESTNPKSAILSVGNKRQIPLSWNLSITVMTLGLIATYFVWRNQQRTV